MSNDAPTAAPDLTALIPLARLGLWTLNTMDFPHKAADLGLLNERGFTDTPATTRAREILAALDATPETPNAEG